MANSRLRVLVVSDMTPLPITGGGERALWEMASGLAGRGHRVTVIGRAGLGGSRQRAIGDGITIHPYEVDRRSPLRFLRTSIFSPGRLAAMLIQSDGADVLHVHQPLSGYGVLHSREAGQVPSLYTLHSPAPMEYRSRVGTSPNHKGGIAGALGAGTLKFLEGACLRKTRRIHVLSDYTARLARELYHVASNRVVKIPGGADLRRFHPAGDRACVRRELGLPEAGGLLLTVRNLEPRMGLDHLVHAFKALSRRRPGVALVVGGEGPLRGQLESLVRTLGLGSRVRFVGFIPDEELPRYYQAADLFILPSVQLEGFGLVTVESLACGTPVLGSRVGATPEILGPLDPGLILWDHAPDLFADDLDRFLDKMERSPEEIETLRARCATHARRHYSWEESIGRLEEDLFDLAAAPKAAAMR